VFFKETRSKSLTDKKSKEVTASPIEAFSEANQSLAENLSVAQERNLKYAQSVFESTIALLKDHAESARSMLEQWEQQALKQHVDPKVAESYLSFFRAPLNASSQSSLKRLRHYCRSTRWSLCLPIALAGVRLNELPR
jgi:hypothetical protein